MGHIAGILRRGTGVPPAAGRTLVSSICFIMKPFVNIGQALHSASASGSIAFAGLSKHLYFTAVLNRSAAQSDQRLAMISMIMCNSVKTPQQISIKQQI
jgi:hypothetical protein